MPRRSAGPKRPNGARYDDDGSENALETERRDSARGCGAGRLAWIERAQGASAVADAAAASSTTAKAVAAAKAFLQTLSTSQRSAVQFSFDSSAKMSGWSNLPTGMVPRNGVAVKDLSAAQVARLDALLKAALSPQGYAQQLAIRKADTYLTEQQASGAGGAQNLQYGEGLYYVAFFGVPSTSSKWTLQFGGHHLAIHMTFSGSTISNTPYFTGVEPGAPFTLAGKTYAPMATKAGALFAAVKSLSSAELAAAKLSQVFDDVLVGPQKDGTFPARQGVTVGSLSGSKQALVAKAVEAYVGDMPAADGAARLRTYRSQFGQTKLSWASSTDSHTSGAYVRVHGPRLWLEIAVQNGVVLQGVHYHSILRDIETDYGAAT
jgi:hypothetical protein